MLVLHTYLYVQRNKNSSDYSKISGDCRKKKKCVEASVKRSTRTYPKVFPICVGENPLLLQLAY